MLGSPWELVCGLLSRSLTLDSDQIFYLLFQVVSVYVNVQMLPWRVVRAPPLELEIFLRPLWVERQHSSQTLLLFLFIFFVSPVVRTANATCRSVGGARLDQLEGSLVKVGI